MKQFLYIFIALFISCSTLAQSIDVEAPKVVEVGEQFQLAFVLNGKRASNFTPPSFGTFKQIGGPMQSFTNINGNKTFKLVYTLRATQEGTHSIGVAHVQFKKQKVSSKPKQIKVVKGSQKAKKGNTFFIRTYASKTNAYQGEAIIYTVKLYTKGEFSYQSFEEPTFTGFWKESIEKIDQNAKRDEYNNEVYNTFLIAKYILYPTKSGMLEIPSPTLNLVSHTYTNTNQVDFFGRRVRNRSDEQLNLKAPNVKIEVKDLPSANKPTSFTGLVGDFEISSKISFTEVRVDDAINLSYTIKGEGNIDLLEIPSMKFPPDFDVFDPEISQSTNNTQNGVYGKKTFKYILIPRTEGTFDIPAMEFSFFDTKEGVFKTVKADGYQIKVGDGVGSEKGAPVESGIIADQKEVHHLDKDIRFIHQDHGTLDDRSSHLLGSLFTPLYFGLSTLLLIAFVWYRKKTALDQQDQQKMRFKRANKMAKKHLRNAAQMMKAEQQKDFYLEISKVLWGYLSDKFSIPRSDLSIAEIVDQLKQKGLDDQSVQEIEKVLHQCEFARFAPEEENKSNMPQIYNASIEIISKIEKGI